VQARRQALSSEAFWMESVDLSCRVADIGELSFFVVFAAEPSLLCSSTIEAVVAGRPSSPHPLFHGRGRRRPPARSVLARTAIDDLGVDIELVDLRETLVASLLEASEGSTGEAAPRGSRSDRAVARGR